MTGKFLGFSKETPPKGGGFQSFENNEIKSDFIKIKFPIFINIASIIKKLSY